MKPMNSEADQRSVPDCWVDSLQALSMVLDLYIVFTIFYSESLFTSVTLQSVIWGHFIFTELTHSPLLCGQNMVLFISHHFKEFINCMNESMTCEKKTHLTDIIVESVASFIFLPTIHTFSLICLYIQYVFI